MSQLHMTDNSSFEKRLSHHQEFEDVSNIEQPRE
jgi:hypothetical protein